MLRRRIILRLIDRLFGPRPAPPPPPITVPPPPPPPVELPPGEPLPAAIEWELLTLINEARAEHGLARLRADLSLVWASADHAGDMDRLGSFDHISPGGQTWQDRARARGYNAPCLEVIAWNFPDAESCLAGWLGSDGHRAILLDPAGVALGAARVGVDWVAMVGYPIGHRSPALGLVDLGLSPYATDGLVRLDGRVCLFA